MPSLSPAEAAVLLAIHHGAGNTKEIAALLNASPEAVEKIVERLKRRGLVEEKTTRRLLFLRSKRLQLTELGLEAVPEARQALAAALQPRPAHVKAGEAPPSSMDEAQPMAELGDVLSPLAAGLTMLGALAALAPLLLLDAGLSMAGDWVEEPEEGGEKPVFDP